MAQRSPSPAPNRPSVFNEKEYFIVTPIAAEEIGGHVLKEWDSIEIKKTYNKEPINLIAKQEKVDDGEDSITHLESKQRVGGSGWAWSKQRRAMGRFWDWFGVWSILIRAVLTGLFVYWLTTEKTPLHICWRGLVSVGLGANLLGHALDKKELVREVVRATWNWLADVDWPLLMGGCFGAVCVIAFTFQIGMCIWLLVRAWSAILLRVAWVACWQLVGMVCGLITLGLVGWVANWVSWRAGVLAGKMAAALRKRKADRKKMAAALRKERHKELAELVHAFNDCDRFKLE